MDGVSGVKGSGPVLPVLAPELFDELPLLPDPDVGGDLFGDPGIAPGIVVAVEPDGPATVA